MTSIIGLRLAVLSHRGWLNATLARDMPVTFYREHLYPSGLLTARLCWSWFYS